MKGQSPKTLTDEQIAEGLRLAGEATPGPWESNGYNDAIVSQQFTRKGDRTKPKRAKRRDIPVVSLDNHAACGDLECCADSPFLRVSEADAMFIAHAGTHYAAALREVQALRQQVQTLTEERDRAREMVMKCRVCEATTRHAKEIATWTK